MTELQKCEFEILKEVLSVCNKLQIPYYLVCGSALGAIKYGGFVPWDDDIDIGMLRKDYERFIQEAQQHLPPHLFLQNFHTDSNFFQLYSKVRDSRTTYIEKSAAHLDMNHGVFIDIFPLDGYPARDAEKTKFESKKTIYKFICDSRFNYKRSRKAEMAVRLLCLLGKRYIRKCLAKYDRLAASYDVASSHIICNHGNWKGKLEYVPQEQYGKGTSAKFEGLDVRIPEKYDEYLTQKYGDWRASPPMELQKSHHYYVVCDLTKPYTEYIKIKNTK